MAPCDIENAARTQLPSGEGLELDPEPVALGNRDHAVYWRDRRDDRLLPLGDAATMPAIADPDLFVLGGATRPVRPGARRGAIRRAAARVSVVAPRQIIG